MANLSRRSLIAASAALPHATRSLAAASNKRVIYIGTQTGNGGAQGIYQAVFDTATGKLSEPRLAVTTASPTFLASFGKFLYAVNEVDSDATISAFVIQPDKNLKLINYKPSQGGAPCHLAVHPSGRAIYVANYGGGSVTTYNILPDGGLSDAVSHFQYEGKGPNKDRQEKAHAHQATLSPDGRFLLVNDLGSDSIHVYRVDATNPAKLTPHAPNHWSARPGSGPRHLAFAPKSSCVYNLNELDSTIDLLKWESGKLTTLGGAASTLAETFKGVSTAAEIAITHNGLFCYASNRGEDTIAIFDISPNDHGVMFRERVSCGGKTPRHFTLSPDERFMVVANQDSGNVAVLRRDTKTGKLTMTSNTIQVSKPMMVLFA